MRSMPSSGRQDAAGRRFRPSHVAKGALLSLFLSLCGCIIAGTMMFFTDLTFDRLPAVAPDLLIILSIIGGSLYSARGGAESGWLHGGLTGLVYVLVTAFLGYLLAGGADAQIILSRLVLGFVIGGISGVIAVNLD